MNCVLFLVMSSPWIFVVWSPRGSNGHIALTMTVLGRSSLISFFGFAPSKSCLCNHTNPGLFHSCYDFFFSVIFRIIPTAMIGIAMGQIKRSMNAPTIMIIVPFFMYG